jgi:hypothetical protein
MKRTNKTNQTKPEPKEPEPNWAELAKPYVMLRINANLQGYGAAAKKVALARKLMQEPIPADRPVN